MLRELGWPHPDPRIIPVSVACPQSVVAARSKWVISRSFLTHVWPVHACKLQFAAIYWLSTLASLLYSGVSTPSLDEIVLTPLLSDRRRRPPPSIVHNIFWGFFSHKILFCQSWQFYYLLSDTSPFSLQRFPSTEFTVLVSLFYKDLVSFRDRQ